MSLYAAHPARAQCGEGGGVSGDFASRLVAAMPPKMRRFQIPIIAGGVFAIKDAAQHQAAEREMEKAQAEFFERFME